MYHKKTALPALYASLLMAFALGAGTSIGAKIAEVTGATGFFGRLIPALLVTVITITGVVLILKKTQLSAGMIGLTKYKCAIRGAFLALATTSAAVAAVFIPALIGGAISFSVVDPGLFAAFLFTNVIIAFLLEAFPEELTLRGLGFSSLRSVMKTIRAAVGITGLFLIVPGLSTIVSALIQSIFTGTVGYIGFAPAGEDPIGYAILIIVFGFTLVAARLATRSETIWTSIVFHLVFLTVNRLLLLKETTTGVSASFASEDAILLVPLYVLVAFAGFYAVRKINTRRIGSKIK